MGSSTETLAAHLVRLRVHHLGLRLEHRDAQLPLAAHLVHLRVQAEQAESCPGTVAAYREIFHADVEGLWREFRLLLQAKAAAVCR